MSKIKSVNISFPSAGAQKITPDSRSGRTFYETLALTSIFMSDAFLMAGKYSPAGVNSWATVIAAAALSCFLMIIIIPHTESAVKSPVFRFLAIFLSLAGIIISISLFASFIKKCVLPQIPSAVIPAAIIAVALYSVSHNFRTLIKSIHVIIPFIIFFITLIMLMLIPSITPEYLFAIAEFKDIQGCISDIAAGTFIFTAKGILLAYLFHEETFPAHKHMKTSGNPKSSPRIDSTLHPVTAGTAAYGIIISIMHIFSVSILGPGLYTKLDYPLYYPPCLTVLGDYFERAEIFSIGIFMTALILKTGIYMRIISVSSYIRINSNRKNDNSM